MFVSNTKDFKNMAFQIAYALCRCELFNGQELHNLKQLAEAVDACK